MPQPVDPITRSVVEHRLTSITREMGEAMLRTSFSQILNSSRDFSIGIVDTRSRLVAQADHIPIHVGALPWATRAVEARFDDIVEGDVFLLNDPSYGGSHLPDVTAFVPVFKGNRRLFWTVVRAHQSDIGGSAHGAYNPSARDIWTEGLRIPPVRLYAAGQQRDDLVDLLALNTRNDRDFRGDLAAMVGAARLGARRILKLLDDVDTDTVLQAIEDSFDAAERRTRAIVSKWKDGVFEGEAFLDDDGHGREDIRIHARVTKTGSNIEVDLTGSDPQSTSFMNSSYANSQSACAMALAFLIDPDVPKNDGAFRPLSVKLKEGTIVWPEPNRPVTMCTSHPSNGIVQAILTALSRSCPDRVMAGWGRRYRIAIQGEDPRNGRKFIWHMFHARPGGGASSAGDGWSSIGEFESVGGLKFGSVEFAEVRFPLHFARHEFLPDSGGKGRYRGGLGVALDLVMLTEKPALANTAGDGARYGSFGMLGGEDSPPHKYRLISKGKKPRVLKTKEVGIAVQPGDVFEIRSAGGGGWGPPDERTAEARAQDELQGLVSKRAG
ncbi:MAG: hydantoinase B/oxoprolinase family protein [Variibacter sp.]